MTRVREERSAADEMNTSLVFFSSTKKGTEKASKVNADNPSRRPDCLVSWVMTQHATQPHVAVMNLRRAVIDNQMSEETPQRRACQVEANASNTSRACWCSVTKDLSIQHAPWLLEKVQTWLNPGKRYNHINGFASNNQPSKTRESAQKDKCLSLVVLGSL